MVNKSQRMKQAGHTARVKDRENIYRIAVGIYYGQTPFELRRLIKVDIISL